MSSTRARSLAAWPSLFAVVIVDGEEGDELEGEEEDDDPALRFRPPPVTRLRLTPPWELILSSGLVVIEKEPRREGRGRVHAKLEVRFEIHGKVEHYPVQPQASQYGGLC